MNYTEIKNAALSYTDRTDNSEVSAQMDSFLRIVEGKINRFLRRLEMTERVTIKTTVDKEYYALPEHFNGLIDIELRDSLTSRTRQSMEYMPPAQLNTYSTLTENLTGKVFYTIVANQLQIMPPQDNKTLEVVYSKRLVPLTSEDQGNWVSLNAPDIYVYGLCDEISKFVKDWSSSNEWSQRFIASITDANLNSDQMRWIGPSMTIKTENYPY